MKVKPLKNYRVPTYPAIDAAGSARELLARIPRRWESSPRLCALLGAGLMVRTLTAGSDAPSPAGATAPTTQAPNESGGVPQEEAAARQVREATSVVAPILAEALQFDGRGAFGCVAVNPPTFLSEAEALELIRNELTAAGLELEHGVELDRVLAPRIGRPSLPRPAGPSHGKGRDAGVMLAVAGTETAASLARPAGEIKVTNWPGGEPELVSRTFVFDFADKDRSLYVEYFSASDHRTWMGSSWSTVQAYDFPALTRKVSQSLSRRESDKRLVFGLFFDPLARMEFPHADATGLDAAQRRMVREESQKARQRAREQLGVKSREKLRRQVRHFVSFLQQEGVIRTPPESRDAPGRTQGQQADAPDTPSDKSL